METKQIAKQLAEYCRKGRFEQAQNDFYSPDCISEEPSTGRVLQTVQGLDAILEKGREFRDRIENVFPLFL